MSSLYPVTVWRCGFRKIKQGGTKKDAQAGAQVSQPYLMLPAIGGGWPSDKRDYSEINDMEALRHVLLLRVVNVAPAQFWQGDWDDQH